MKDLQYYSLLIMLIYLLLISCSPKQHYKSSVYINVYGDFKEQVILKLDKDIVLSKRISPAKWVSLDAIRGPIHYSKDKIKIYFSIDGKDTSFIYPLKSVNYISVGYSNRRHEFQFTLPDSANFFMPRI
jgi:hypothetical protein